MNKTSDIWVKPLNDYYGSKHMNYDAEIAFFNPWYRLWAYHLMWNMFIQSEEYQDNHISFNRHIRELQYAFKNINLVCQLVSIDTYEPVH